MLVAVTIENLKILKYHTFWKTTLLLSIICRKCNNKDKKVFSEKESIEILIGLCENILLL